MMPRWTVAGAAITACALVAGSSAQQPPELIIRNGLIVTAAGSRTGDVRIRGESIAEIGTGLAAPAGAREIDASGKLVLPGGVDPHTHLLAERPNPPRPLGVQDDYTSGSAAAFAGGVTTISNYVTRHADEEVGAFIDRIGGEVHRLSMADVGLHVMAGNDPAWLTPQTLAMLADRGYTSTKTFMINAGFDANAASFLRFYRASAAAGMLSMIHCEDGPMIAELGERMLAEGRGSLHNFAQSRPVVTEVVATQRAVAIAELTGAPMYIVHLSAGRALRVAEEAMARGVPVYVETRPIYLHFTRHRYARPDVGLYMGDPPLREQQDQEALWAGLARGTVHAVGSDNVSFSRASKLDPTQTVAKKRAGMNVLQVYRPLLYSEGVHAGRISLERFVEVTATNPAKLFGMYPRKGTIEVGSDADIAIWDPTLKRTIRDEDELSNTKYSIFAGWEVTGWPTTTIRRGEVVYQDGKVLAKPGTGKVIPQSRWRKPGLLSTSH